MPEVVFNVLREGAINQLSNQRNVDVELIGVESGHPEILASEASKSQWILAVVTSDPKRTHRRESTPARGGKTNAGNRPRSSYRHDRDYVEHLRRRAAGEEDND